MSPPANLFCSRLRIIWIGILSLWLAGCSDEDKILVENVLSEQENRPPLIVTYTPEFTSGSIERVSNGSPRGVSLQVLAGDPDGLDDISLVTIDIESVRLRRFLLRPDTSTTGCLIFSYASDDTVPTGTILAVPALFPGIHLRRIQRVEGGLFVEPDLGGWGVGFPDILGASTNMVRWGGGCLRPTGIDYPYVILPPVYPGQRAAALTYADVDYLGIKLSVFDKVGATAVAALPDLRIVFTTIEEKSALP